MCPSLVIISVLGSQLDHSLILPALFRGTVPALHLFTVPEFPKPIIIPILAGYVFDMLSFHFFISISLGKVKISLIILRKVCMCTETPAHEHWMMDDPYLNFLSGTLDTWQSIWNIIFNVKIWAYWMLMFSSSFSWSSPWCLVLWRLPFLQREESQKVKSKDFGDSLPVLESWLCHLLTVELQANYLPFWLLFSSSGKME